MSARGLGAKEDLMSQAHARRGRERPRQRNGSLPARLLLLAVAALAMAACGPQPTPTPAPTATPAPPPAPPTPAAAPPTTTPRPAALTPRFTPTELPGGPFTLGPKSFGRAGLDGQDVAVLATGGTDQVVLYAGGKGVSKSTDGGKSWTSVRNADQAPRVAALAVAPSNAQTVYVGVSEGCAKGTPHPALVSTDGGATWRDTGQSARNVSGLAVDPKNARLVYAASCGGVLRSPDAGVSWETLAGARLANYDPSLIAIAPSDPQTLYVAYASEGGTVRVRRSSDAGTTWQDANPPGDLVGPLALTVDATAAGTLYLSTTTGLYKTTNGGRAWSLLVRGLEETVDTKTTPTASRGTPTVVLRTNSALVTDPEEANRLWLRTAGGPGKGTGVYRSRDGGGTWEKAATGLEGHPVRGLVMTGLHTNRQLYAATDDGVWLLSAP